MGNQFSKINAGNIVIINKQILFEIIEKRIYETKVKIEDLFLLCKAPNGQEGEQTVDTPYGKLRVFFINKDLETSWLLHKKKYNYPVISKVSSKGSHKVEKIEYVIRPFQEDLTSEANQHIKKEFVN